MKAIETTEQRIALKRKNGSIIPGGLWQYLPIGIKLLEANHPFLDQVVKAGPWVIQSENDRELIIFAYSSLVLIRVYETHVQLEYIATYEAERVKGSGTNTMRLLTKIANKTGTTLKLVTGYIPSRNIAPTANPVIKEGAKPENRIPFHQLTSWFEKFGFVAGGEIKNDYKREHGIESEGTIMERQPVKK